ncbi:MAG: MqnA/MqnD/SBP family protein [bacterium]
MKTRIAIPTDSIFSKFSGKKDEISQKFDLTVFELDENKCFELYLSNKVDTVLTSPLTYGLHIGKLDSVIIPVSAVSLMGYSEIASLIFKKELKTFSSTAANDTGSYLFNITKILLAERYDMFPKVVQSGKTESELLNSADAGFILGITKEGFNSLDIGEEWFDTFEMPLPIAFWVCRSEEHPENIEEIIKEWYESIGTKNIQIFEKLPKDSDLLNRQGSISFEFNEEFEEALAQTFHFLFYHQLIPEIPEIKILGREEKEIL